MPTLKIFEAALWRLIDRTWVHDDFEAIANLLECVARQVRNRSEDKNIRL